ncbi:MAG: hypothetical protein EP330_22975 [Deltaproteobacteria bacterium]|nr:MAG: hypothetical protein EP330_22975 [Deltaproteobacteria bacterium]
MLVLLLALAAHAAPGFVPVQGVLTDSTGTRIDGQVDVTFTLYDDSAGSTSLWTDTLTLDVVDGAFATELGAGGVPLDLDTFGNYGGAHLQIQVSGDSPMPLVPLAHVPYAAWANRAGTADALQGMSLGDLRAEIPATSDMQQAARDVAYDTETELLADLDDNYTYTAGTGIAVASNVISVDQATIEGWASGVCYDSEAELLADLDDNYTYTAGTGISVASNVISADQATIEGWASTLIGTHASNAAAHHTRYSDTDALSATASTYVDVAGDTMTGNLRVDAAVDALRYTIRDTRDVDDAPSVFDREMRVEFKRRSTVGVPGAGTYGGTVTIAPWGDNSGDASHQLHFNEGGVYWRQGQPDGATWGSWQQVWTGDTMDGVTLTNATLTGADISKACPSGWTSGGNDHYCYSPVQTASNGHNAQIACTDLGADTCTVGQYYQIGTTGCAGNQCWTNSYCAGTDVMWVTSGSGWDCANWNTQLQYRCCMDR